MKPKKNQTSQGNFYRLSVPLHRPGCWFPKNDEGSHVATNYVKIIVYLKSMTEPPEVVAQRYFIKKGVLKFSAKFTGKNPHQSPFFNKFADCSIRHSNNTEENFQELPVS